MRLNIRHNSRGVALLAALFVLMVMSILAIGMLSNVDEDLKISKNFENSERALKIAEHGVQIARANFFDPFQKTIDIGADQPVQSVNGFINGGYFLTYLTSGFAGNETWTQWRYNFSLTGNNTESEITAPLFNVWATNQLGVNGYWTMSGTTPDSFYVSNIYGVVATGVYFPIQQLVSSSTDTTIRSHHEYTGKFVSDRNVIGGGGTSYASNVSPFASYTRYKDRATLKEQVLYFTYSGGAANTGSAPETSSTVRLRAVNVCPTGDCVAKASDVNVTTKKGKLDVLWEFDTGLHGAGTAPTMFDPSPPDASNTDNRHRGDEIIYFAVISYGKPTTTTTTNGDQTPVAGWNYSYTFPPGASRTHDFSETYTDSRSFPVQANQFAEQIYLFAVVDTINGYRLKWARPFPDPDVAEWTDYPTEHATGTLGQRPPFVARPSDITPYPLEDDFLTDYRDGPGNTGLAHTSKRGQDKQWNQVRGDIGPGESPPCSPPVLHVLYQDKNKTGQLTTNYEDATDASKMNPTIDVYLMYSNIVRGTFLNFNSGGTYPRPVFGGAAGTASVKTIDNQTNGTGWGDPGYRKPNAIQTRVIALRDRLVPLVTTPSTDIATSNWKWTDPLSRYPEFKWMYRVPGWDPNETDTIPATGYGEYSWDTWFTQQVAPMVIAQTNNSEDNDGDNRRGERDLATGKIDEGAKFSDLTNDGTQSAYPVVYTYYRSQGFPTGGGDGKASSYNTHRAPTTGLFSASMGFNNGWDDNRIMVMAMRDTWDDYRKANRTNIYGASNANPNLSNPVEPYWYYSDYDRSSGPNVADYKYQNGKTMVTYRSGYAEIGGGTRTSPFPSGVQAGFPRPYNFSESLWLRNVKEAAHTEEWGMLRQGWTAVPLQTTTGNPFDSDIEGETAAVCRECLNGDGLFVLPFNIDLTETTDANQREDLRMHGINARTGLHVWDYHAAASQGGDNANNTPAIANNKVFFAHVQYGAEATRANRNAIVTALDASDGSALADPKIFDADADAVILPPTIANGMTYIATYDYAGPNAAATMGSSWTRGDSSDDLIRLFALSPIIRLVSTGVYPVGYQDRATISNYSSLLIDRGSQYATKRIGQSRRKLQVWVTGDTSRWEELKENIE